MLHLFLDVSARAQCFCGNAAQTGSQKQNAESDIKRWKHVAFWILAVAPGNHTDQPCNFFRVMVSIASKLFGKVHGQLCSRAVREKTTCCWETNVMLGLREEAFSVFPHHFDLWIS